MIRNLNRLTFKDFGTISSERIQNPNSSIQGRAGQMLHLTPGKASVYQAISDTWIYCTSGMTVLSVSKNSSDFQYFYLDKPVCLEPGTYFYLSPFRQESTASVELRGEQLPKSLDRTETANDFQVPHQLHVTNLYTFFYHEKEQGFFFPGESHPMFELTYVDQGSMHSVADGQDFLLDQGEMVIYGANQWHMQYADIGIAPRYVTISFDLEGNDLSILTNRKFKPPQAVVTLLQQMLREQERMESYATDMIISLLSLLLLTLLRQTDVPDLKLKASNSIHSENEIIRRAQQYISNHIREKLTVPIVSRKVDVSPSYLTALFHKNLQISPGEYIRRIKLQESKQMIREDNLNFTEIAATLQYSTVHHFSRQFKEKFGITPTEYAKSVR